MSPDMELLLGRAQREIMRLKETNEQLLEESRGECVTEVWCDHTK